MTAPASWVFVLDDDPSVRKSLERLFRAADLQVRCFASSHEFRAFSRPDVPCCLVLDERMPDVAGTELQRMLEEEGVALPIIFITGYGDVPTSVRAMKAGAVDFLTKPFEDEVLLAAVRQALEQETRRQAARGDVPALRQRFATLSPREQDVLAHVVGGLLNKQIAHRLKVTEKTIKVHRGQVMRKMGAGSLAELVRMAQKLGIEGPCERSPDVP